MNPADAPFAACHAAKTVVEAWLADAYLREAGRQGVSQGSLEAREYFAGKGGLTKALHARGMVCVPLESHRVHGYQACEDLENDFVVKDEVQKIWKREIWYCHFGIDCCSWGSLGRLNSGTRTMAEPLGERNSTQGSERKLAVDEHAPYHSCLGTGWRAVVCRKSWVLLPVAGSRG